MLNKLLLILLLSVPIFAADMKIQNRELSNKDMKTQSIDIVKMAASEISKSLPQKIDKYTTLNSVKAKNKTLIYFYELNIAPKTDESVINEDHTRMKQAVTIGTCRGSIRFLEAGITLKYIYTSKSTKKELFQFNINQESCKKI